MEKPVMERRVGSRARVDLPVSTYVDGFWHDCRVVDLSATGMVVERTRSLSTRTTAEISSLELQLGDAPIRLRARKVWADGRFVALRFIVVDDVDRITIAEHLDRVAVCGQTLH